MELDEALKAAVARHYPVYPVCDADGVLKGLIRGEELFAQPGDRDLRPVGQDGRRRQGGAARRRPSRAASSFAIPGSRSTCSPPSSPPRWSALFENTLEPAGHPRRLPAGDGGADRQYRLPGARGDAARHDARRAQAGPGQRGWSPRRRCSASATASWSASPPALGMVVYASMQGEAQPLADGPASCWWR